MTEATTPRRYLTPPTPRGRNHYERGIGTHRLTQEGNSMSFEHTPYDDLHSDDEETRKDREAREDREDEYEARHDDGEDPRSEDEKAWQEQRDWKEAGVTEDDMWGETDPDDRTPRD